MKDKLYLESLKQKLNDDSSKKVVFEESQTGPQEEPILVAYDVDVNKFVKYKEMLLRKRNK